MGFKLCGCALFVLFKKKKIKFIHFCATQIHQSEQQPTKVFCAAGWTRERDWPSSVTWEPPVRGQSSHTLLSGQLHYKPSADTQRCVCSGSCFTHGVCLRRPRVLVVSPPHILLFRGKNALPPTTTITTTPHRPPHAHLLGSVCPWVTDWPVLPLHLLRRSSWLLQCARSTSPGSPLWVSVPRFGGFHLCVKLVRTPPRLLLTC